MAAFDAKAPSPEILRHEMYEVDEEIHTAEDTSKMFLSRS
jgi:hypothetical protein